MRVALLAVLLVAVPMSWPPASVKATPLPEAEVRAIVCQPRYTWSCTDALAIVWRESNYDPQAVNPSGASGLWQIMPLHGFPQWALFDPWFCTQVAYDLYQRYEWLPWRTQ